MESDSKRWDIINLIKTKILEAFVSPQKGTKAGLVVSSGRNRKAIDDLGSNTSIIEDIPRVRSEYDKRF